MRWIGESPHSWPSPFEKGGKWAAPAALLILALPVIAEDVAEIEVGFVNGVYENLDSDLQPIRRGSLTIRVSSPEHRLTVHGNRLSLERDGDGTVAASMEVDFEGGGDLIADIDGLGRFTDVVKVPRQSVRAQGTVRIARDEDGYLVTVVDADRFVLMDIESGMAREMVDTCRALAMLPFISLPCGSLETALATVSVPMPGPGEQFRVRAADLSSSERAFFDRFLTE